MSDGGSRKVPVLSLAVGGLALAALTTWVLVSQSGDEPDPATAEIAADVAGAATAPVAEADQRPRPRRMDRIAKLKKAEELRGPGGPGRLRGIEAPAAEASGAGLEDKVPDLDERRARYHQRRQDRVRGAVEGFISDSELPEESATALRAVYEDAFTRADEIQAAVAAEEMTPEQAREARKQLQDETRSELSEVLTEEQLKALDDRLQPRRGGPGGKHGGKLGGRRPVRQ